MTDEEFNAMLADKKFMARISNRVGWLVVWEIAKLMGPWIIGFAIGVIYGSLRTQWLIGEWIKKQ